MPSTVKTCSCVRVACKCTQCCFDCWSLTSSALPNDTNTIEKVKVHTTSRKYILDYTIAIS